MLGKLIKHEFRATGRLMAPLFGALLLLAVFSRVTNQILQQVPNPTRVLYIVSVLLAIVYVLAGLGVMVFSTVLMIKRFHQNFLTDEGYLMFTLPVSVHSLLWSKLITAALFFLFTFAEHEVGEKIEDRAEDKICEQGQEHGTVDKLGDGVRSLTDDPIDDDHAAA